MLPIAIVPVKQLEGAKGRLRSRLPADARQALVVHLLIAVLTALEESGAVRGRVVVSPDPDVLAVAAEMGADGLPQQSEGLNEALEAARATVGSAESILVVAADLPLLTAAEVREMVALAPAVPGMVIAPDAAATGTNGLLLRPAGGLPFAFGPGSFARHVAAARMAGLAVEIYHSPGTAFDLDTPAQLDELRLRHAALFGRLVPDCVTMGMPAGGAA